MAVTTTFTYLGRTTEGYHMWSGLYAFEAADLYDRDARPSLTFSGLSTVLGIMGVTDFCDGTNNLGNVVSVLSIATNVVTFMVLESGAAAAGLNEKTDDEAYGIETSFRCTVIGV